MGTPRRKSDTMNTPQTTTEAAAMAATYLDHLSDMEQLKLDADKAIDEIRAARDEAMKPIEQRAKELFANLRAWFTVEKAELTEGKRKSIELAGAEIGERMTPPRLVHPALKAEDVIERLLDAGYDEMVRTKHSLDKPALIKMLRGDHAVFFQALGIDVAQREEFFIDRVEPEASDPEKVETGEIEIREAKS